MKRTPTNFDEIYKQYAEGTPLSTLAKRFNVSEVQLRKWFNETR